MSRASALALSCAAILSSIATAADFDIGTPNTTPFDQAVDRLTNTDALTTWDLATGLRLSAGSDLNGIDITGLGVETMALSGYNTTVERNFSNTNMSSLTITSFENNGLRSFNFTGANFSGSTFDLGDNTASGNQPFLNSTIANADFSGAIFNYAPFTNAGGDRVNIFRQEAGAGMAYSGADFTDAVFNLSLTGSLAAGSSASLFNGGSGAVDAASAGDALSFIGADFNLTGGSPEEASAIATILINNLGGFDAETPIGAIYDDAFVSNSAADFNFAATADFKAALDTAGWQESAGDSFAILDIELLADDMIRLTWESIPNQNYTIFYSFDLSSLDGDFGDNVEGDAGETTTRTVDLAAFGLEGLPDLFFRVTRSDSN